MGALGFLLMATMKGFPLSPARCWNDPLMPQAMYTLGFTVCPDEPTCRDFASHFASTTGREQLTAAPMASASSWAIATLSFSWMPRPIDTRTGCLLISTSPDSATIVSRYLRPALSPPTSDDLSIAFPFAGAVSTGLNEPGRTLTTAPEDMSQRTCVRSEEHTSE